MTDQSAPMNLLSVLYRAGMQAAETKRGGLTTERQVIGTVHLDRGRSLTVSRMVRPTSAWVRLELDRRAGEPLVRIDLSRGRRSALAAMLAEAICSPSGSGRTDE